MVTSRDEIKKQLENWMMVTGYKNETIAENILSDEKEIEEIFHQNDEMIKSDILFKLFYLVKEVLQYIDNKKVCLVSEALIEAIQNEINRR